MPHPAPLLSIVIPAFNEEANVAPIYQAIRAALGEQQPVEILYVDDGSTDGTAGAVRALRDGGAPVRLLRFGRNFGHQAALWAGLSHACGEAVVTMDADLQHPPRLLGRMIETWRGGACIVQMVRRRSEGAGWFKRLSSALFYRFLNLLSEQPVQSGAADFQLLDRRVVDALLQFRDRRPFLRGLVGWLGFATTRIEYDAPARAAGHSAYTLRRMVRLSVHAITALSSKPLRFSFYLGLSTALVCLAYAAYSLVVLALGKTVPGWTSLIFVVLFLGALQMVSLGIIGEYVARIYEQARDMPRYVVVEESGPSLPKAASAPGSPAPR
jgi:polyisoprenyl-phosphate glycosyltransferase